MNEPTGLDLKLERIGRRVTGRRLAREMGVHPSRVSAIEAQQFLLEATVARYRAALDTCATSGTSEKPQAVA